MTNVYEKAIDILRERGWYQGSYYDRDGTAVCLLGALGIAHNDTYDGWLGTIRDDEYGGLWNAIESLGYDRRDYDTETPSGWNDAPERTVEDVLLVLKHCAAEADSCG